MAPNALHPIHDSCYEYLSNEVPSQNPVAVWLNDASAEEAQACVASVNCTRDFIIDVMEAFAKYLDSGSTSDLMALLNLLITGQCMD